MIKLILFLLITLLYSLSRYNRYMNTLARNNYIRLRNQRLRIKAIELLGGKCVICGTTKNLEFDHIIRGTREFTIATGLRLSWARILKELEKCQLLCHKHHLEKTNRERLEWQRRAEHGTPSMYSNQGCRCDDCTTAWRQYYRGYWRKKRYEMVA